MIDLSLHIARTDCDFCRCENVLCKANESKKAKERFQEKAG